MKDYTVYSDEELIEMLRDGDDAITDYLMDKYKHLVRKEASHMFILGADKEDLIQEGMIGLYKAIRDYDNGRDASFFTFADLCVSRQMYSAVKSSARKKHSMLNEYISVFGGADVDDDETRHLIDMLESERQFNPENYVIDRENVSEIWDIVDEIGSPLERSVFELHVIGMSPQQIAAILAREQKSTDNALAGIKSK